MDGARFAGTKTLLPMRCACSWIAPRWLLHESLLCELGAVLIRRRPISRSPYRWAPEAKGPSLRYELLLDGAVRKYPDGREVCQDSFSGRREYLRRLEIMLQRQNYSCCLCSQRMKGLQDATFEHQRRRGMHAAFRDDRIYNERGEQMNGAAHWVCNGEKG